LHGHPGCVEKAVQKAQSTVSPVGDAPISDAGRECRYTSSCARSAQELSGIVFSCNVEQE
jgi:hypothetical protein